MVYAGRVMSGMSAGTITILNTVYIGEIASTNIRGILLTASGIFYTVGIIIIYSLGPYVAYATTNYIGAALELLYLIGIFFIPETPVFNVLKGNDDKAIETLHFLGRKEDIDKLIKSKETIQQINIRLKEWLEIFTERINRKTIFILITLHILQSTSGVVAVVFFATTIFELAGSSIEPNIATIIIGMTQLFASLFPPLLIERAGRKSLLLASTALCTISLAVLGMYLHFDINGYPATENIKWLPLVTLIIFLVANDFGLGIIPQALMGEMFLPNVRSTGSIFVGSISWFIGFWVLSYFRPMLVALGGDFTFWIYSGSCGIAFLFTLLFVPETKEKSLFDIHEMLNQKSILYLNFK